MMYAGGVPTSDPDVLLYDLCMAFHCLPSDLEQEESSTLERLAYINYIVQSKLAAEAEAKSHGRN